jgi:hypothetical protein
MEIFLREPEDCAMIVGDGEFRLRDMSGEGARKSLGMVRAGPARANRYNRETWSRKIFV